MRPSAGRTARQGMDQEPTSRRHPQVAPAEPTIRQRCCLAASSGLSVPFGHTAWTIRSTGSTRPHGPQIEAEPQVAPAEPTIRSVALGGIVWHRQNRRSAAFRSLRSHSLDDPQHRQHKAARAADRSRATGGTGRTDEPQRCTWRHRLGFPFPSVTQPGRSAAPAAQGRTGRRSKPSHRWHRQDGPAAEPTEAEPPAEGEQAQPRAEHRSHGRDCPQPDRTAQRQHRQTPGRSQPQTTTEGEQAQPRAEHRPHGRDCPQPGYRVRRR